MKWDDMPIHEKAEFDLLVPFYSKPIIPMRKEPLNEVNYNRWRPQFTVTYCLKTYL